MDFPVISRRLQQCTAADLVGNGATWYQNCHTDTVNSHKVEHAEKAYQRKVLLISRDITDKENVEHTSISTHERPFTRSSCDTLKADRCFFGNEDPLHEVTSFNVGRRIREAVESSQNRAWQVKLQPLNPDDARSIDVKYHLYCYVKYVQRSGQQAASYDDHIREVCVDTEFFSIMRNMLTGGKFVAMDAITGIYDQLMLSSGLNRTYTSKEVKAKILKNMASEVEFARPHVNRPETICSRESKNAAVCGAAAQAEDLEQDMLHIMKCATVVRRNILDSVAQKWSFSDTLCEPEYGQSMHTPAAEV